MKKVLPPTQKVEEKLYNNRYLVDSGNPHVKIIDTKNPSPALEKMVNICPAGCYSKNDDGKIEVQPDGCMECGTCRIVTSETGELQWDYPRGGYGISFKFG
jgi:ferredoxin like protein